ncbi:hypothetical protein PAXRUDRAFT_829613 [Paxillus rubicundulus Ve08.2h10]|uniref:Uncharacterized protein n=1 Tax=Paxillus rubicundulus Ve08.2h10 TaxID=930991 RepID=A0A0D0DUM6_9AGAM|nr:hypothetical protein PAXRUDRAFT_829613 [Paxillus rubicundulus Ve08.2h10]
MSIARDGTRSVGGTRIKKLGPFVVHHRRCCGAAAVLHTIHGDNDCLYQTTSTI